LADIARLKARTTEVYGTATAAKKPPKRDPLVEKLLRSVERRIIDGRLGQVRMRASLTNEDEKPLIELFDGAFKA
jgi:hypothetical protein